MKTVKIEKFVEGRYETSFNIPTFVLGMAKMLLPSSALAELAREGFPVREIMEANARGIPCCNTFNVLEHGISKQVRVSLDMPLKRLP